jgi:serine phosphatase RsbU (regulator of sigma subunit)
MFKYFSSKQQNNKQNKTDDSTVVMGIDQKTMTSIHDQSLLPGDTARAMTSFDNFEEIESMLPSAKELMDDISDVKQGSKGKLPRRNSRDMLHEILQALEEELTNDAADVVGRS